MLRFRGADLIGIINGVDTEAWNPQTDEFIAANYSLSDMKGKSACKKALQKRLGLEVSAKKPVFGVVSRLYSQKGLDLLARIAGELVGHMESDVLPKFEGDLSGLRTRLGKAGINVD